MFVYSICNGGHSIFLEQRFEGKNRYQCQKFIKNLNRNGRHTATTFVSSLSYDQAKRRYIDGRY